MEKQIEDLQQEYMQLTNKRLPKLAETNNWVIRFNHCFQRVILDNLFEDCWYGHLDKNSQTPAYKQLNRSQIEQAVQIAQEMVKEGHSKVEQLNQNSLQYRGKN